MLPSMSKHPQQDGGGATHFGYRRVADNEKASLVREVFDSVASQYDLMNDRMSLGVHPPGHGPRVEWLSPMPGQPLPEAGRGPRPYGCSGGPRHHSGGVLLVRGRAGARPSHW